MLTGLRRLVASFRTVLFARSRPTHEYVSLYRAISEAEWMDIVKTSRLRPGPPSNQGKWFAESLNDAEEWGRLLSGPASLSFQVIRIDFPKDVAAVFFRLP